MTTPIKTILTLAALSVAGTLNASAAEDAALLARGEYIVEKVGLCADCHSPRNERGEFIREAYLGGAALPFAPTVPMPVWAPAAPPIAGLPSMTKAQAVTFLTTGRKPDGTEARPPMPAFRFNEGDARAVVAYLQSFAAKK